MRFGTDIGCFEIDTMPSQVQVAICHGFFLYEHKRGQGLAAVLHVQQLTRLIEQGYDFAICTVSGENPAQSRAIEKAGWTLVHTFYNARQSTQSQVWTVDLNAIRSQRIETIMARELVEA